MTLRRTRTALAALALCLLAVDASAASLARLADAFVAEVAATTSDSPVVFAVPEDHTGTAVALDLHALVLSRLRARPTREGAVPVHAVAVVAFEGNRLVLSARLTRDGELLDVVTVSVDRSSGALPLARQFPTGSRTGLDVLGSELSPPLSTDVVALAFLDSPARIAVLAPSEILVYRREGAALRVEARAPVPATIATRRPGGRLLVEGDVVTAWTSGCPDGRSFRVGPEALTALGPPRTTGWRFEDGTNVLVGDGGRALAVVSGVVLDDRGRLGGTELPTGGVLAVPWPDVAITSSALAAGATDELQVTWLDTEPGVDGVVPVAGDVRALAALRSGSRATVAAAVRSGGQTHLLLLEVGRPEREGEATP